MGENGTVKIIGIAGGSGSGKTTLANWLLKYFGPQRAGLLSQDSYYYDQSADFDHDGGAVNFDHPDAIDFDLMAEQLEDLIAGDPIDVPIYDFATHSRLDQTNWFQPREIILVDGILILGNELLCELFDASIFISTPEEVRFSRRLRRDTHERGRTAEGVREQFYRQVKPMHDQFVEPSRENADLILSGEMPVAEMIEKIEASGIFADF